MSDQKVTPISEPKPDGTFIPLCGHCGEKFIPVGNVFNVENGVQLLVLSCASCRKVNSTVIYAMPQPRVQPPPQKIVRPF